MATQIATCQHCGAAYELEASYISQCAGTTAQCHNCKQEFAIPQLAPARSVPPPLPATFHVHRGATPGAAVGVWREGNRIVAIKGAVLPQRCIKCNVPCSNSPVTRSYHWHPPALDVLHHVLPGLAIYLIAAMKLRQSAKLTFWLCPHHRKVRRRFIWIGCMSVPAVVGLRLLEIRFFSRNDDLFIPFVLLDIVVFIGLVVTGVRGTQLLRPMKIDNSYLWMVGAGPEFLGTLQGTA